MKVYMLKDVENIGMAGQVVTVSDGYADNFLIPRKMALKVTAKSEQFFVEKSKKITAESEAITTKMGMVAERIKNMHVTLRKRSHDDGKLYGAVSADEICKLLKTKEVSVNKKQVVFGKAIKTTGEYEVTIKLSSKLQPGISLKVVAE